MKVADPTWVEVDPMGHEHRFEGEIVPTVDADFRCRRCGHKTTPRFLEPVIAAGVMPAILAIEIEMRNQELEISSTPSGGAAILPGGMVAILHLDTTTGPYEFMLDDTEMKQAEAYAASKGDMEMFAKWVLARRGVVL